VFIFFLLCWGSGGGWEWRDRRISFIDKIVTFCATY
jgi:hypothetical protein